MLSNNISHWVNKPKLERQIYFWRSFYIRSYINSTVILIPFSFARSIFILDFINIIKSSLLSPLFLCLYLSYNHSPCQDFLFILATKTTSGLALVINPSKLSRAFPMHLFLERLAFNTPIIHAKRGILAKGTPFLGFL